MSPAVSVVRSAPKHSLVTGVPVGTSGAIPRSLGQSRGSLGAAGFDGKLGQTLVLPGSDGKALVAVGIGDPAALDAAGLRTAAASLVRAAGTRASVSTTLADLPGVDARLAGQAVAEGALLGAYRYAGIHREVKPPTLTEVALVVGPPRADAVAAGCASGTARATAAILARDLANTPPAYLTARDMAAKAVAIAADSARRLQVEVFDEAQLREMGCGGMIGVNRGSAEPPQLVKLSYTPRNASGHLALVGKGVMFDSGGLSLKPSDSMIGMKMDMSGAAAVLATMSVLAELKCKSRVTGYLMCTDNMSGGDAYKLGDVLTFRNGKTAEIHNTDAEGRLVLADGLSLAVEDGADAIVDIATLTGACMVALGNKIAGIVGNDQPLVDTVSAAAAAADESVWQLPLEARYRKLLDSQVADMRNIGGPYGGAITASLFLSEFVGTTPWVHIDMAGPMASDADDGWLSKGATGFGTRLMIELALGFNTAAPRRRR